MCNEDARTAPFPAEYHGTTIETRIDQRALFGIRVESNEFEPNLFTSDIS